MDLLSHILFGPDFLTLAIDPLVAASAISAGASLLGGGGGEQKEMAERDRKAVRRIGRSRLNRSRTNFAQRAPVRKEFLKGAVSFGDSTNPFNKAPGDSTGVLAAMKRIGQQLRPGDMAFSGDRGLWENLRNYPGAMDVLAYQGDDLHKLAKPNDGGGTDASRAKFMRMADRQNRINELLGFGL